MMVNLFARSRLLLRQARLMSAFGRDERGVAMLEFAFVLPVSLAFLGFIVILGEALEMAQKVSLTARTISDMVSKNTTLTQSGLQTILNASGYTMTPYDTSTLGMVVSEIVTDSSGNATVVWSYAASSYSYGASALAVGSTVTLPSSAVAPNSTYILGTVSYKFTPPVIGPLFTQSVTLSDFALFNPRQSTRVTVQ